MRNNFASRLTQTRQIRGLSPEELARKAGMEPDAIKLLESGGVRNGWRFSEIASVLGVSLKWLATGIEEEVSTNPAGEGTSCNTGTFASRLVQARNAIFWTQKDLSEATGINQTTISHLEKGRNKSSRQSTALAAALGVSEEWLVTGEEREPLIHSEKNPSKSQTSIRPAIMRRLLNAAKALSVEQIEQLANSAESLVQQKEITPLKATHPTGPPGRIHSADGQTLKKNKLSQHIKKAS